MNNIIRVVVGAMLAATLCYATNEPAGFSCALYILTTNVDQKKLETLPVFAQTSAFTHGNYSNRMVHFRVYVREIGQLAHIEKKGLLLAHPERGKMFEGRIDYDNSRRQGVPAFDFVVDESCLSTSYLKLCVPHHQGGHQEYWINLKLLFDGNITEDLDAYSISNNLEAEKNSRFREFLQRKFEIPTTPRTVP